MARKAQAQSTVTVSAFAAMPAAAQQALIAAGVAIVPDDTGKGAKAPAPAPKVSDADIRAAAMAYTDKKGAKHVRFTGSPAVQRLDDAKGIVVGTDAEGKGLRLMSYFVNKSGNVFASTVGTYSVSQLEQLAQAVSDAAVNAREGGDTVSDVATLRAQVTAAKRRADIIAAMKSAGVAVPNGVNKWGVSVLRDFALEALGE